MYLKTLAILLLSAASVLAQTGTVTVGSTGKTQPPVTTLTMNGTNLFLTRGAGDPNSVVTANPGSLYMDTGGALWVKTTGTGNTGWSAPSGGSGTVTNFSAGDLSPLFTTTETTTTTTPALSFTLSNSAAHTYFGNNTGSTGPPSFNVIDYGELSGTPTIPTIGGSNTEVQFNNSGVFGGSSSFTWFGDALRLTAPEFGGQVFQISDFASNPAFVVYADETPQVEIDILSSKLKLIADNTHSQVVGAGTAGSFSLDSEYGMSNILGRNNTDGIAIIRATDTSPTGNFENFLSHAYAPLWTVDITGSLAAGTVPIGRVTGVVPTSQAGLPTGGTTAQALTKIDAADYNAQWTTLSIPSVAAPLDLTVSDATTNTIVDTLYLGHNSSATPIAAFGSQMIFRAQDSTTPDAISGKISAAWTTATHGSNVSDIVFSAVSGGAAGSYTNPMTLKGNGTLNVTTGYTVAGVAPTNGKILQSDGAKYNDSTPTWPTSASTTGKVVQSDGTNLVMSTPTFPATAGTSGNVLTSNGTNWLSSAPATSGTISSSGTPATDELAIWTDATHIKGVTLSGSGATATLSGAGLLTLSAIPNTTLSNSAITIAGTSTALGTSITLDTLSGVSSNGFLKRTGVNTWTNDASTYLTGNQTVILSGDVTGSGATAITTTLANIPTGVTMAGSLLATAIAAPGTPAAGKGSIYVDSTSKNLAVKDDAGTVKHGVQTKASVANNFLTAINDAGSVTAAQPAFTDISGTATTGQVPDLGGNPSASVGLSAVNGSATTYLRSDGAPALSLAIAPAWTGQHTFSEARTVGSGTSAVLDDVNASAQTTTVTGTTQITTAKGFNKVSLYQPTYTDASSVTIDQGATLYIEAAPLAAGSVTLTNKYALWVDSDTARFDGGLTVGGTAAPSAGVINASTGFTIGGAAASGKHLVGDGTNFVASTPTFPNAASPTTGKLMQADGTNWVTSTMTWPSGSAPTSGKVMISDGTNIVASTPTFPNASATSRKKIVSDGTNWVASTETWAVPGTSGNVLTSDGTNWLSSAPAAATVTSPLDLTISDAATNTIVEDLFIGHNSSATPVATFGSRMVFRAKDSTTADAISGKIEAAWTTATHSSNVSNMVFSAVSGGAAGSYTNPMTLKGNGILDITSGITIGGAAASGKILQSTAGTQFTTSTPTWPTAASTSGKAVVSDGTNLVMSTPTFPNASATSGKVIKSDGTNWVASTETHAAPGTAGNHLVSDGTNWTAAMGVGILCYVKSLTLVTSGSPVDLGTITVPAWAATRYRVPGVTANAAMHMIVTETQGGTPAAGTCEARTTTGGAGTVMLPATAPSNGAGTLANWGSSSASAVFTNTSITVRQTVNSANTATCSFYIFVEPIP